MEPEGQEIGQDTPARTGTVGKPIVQQQEYEENNLAGERNRPYYSLLEGTSSLWTDFRWRREKPYEWIILQKRILFFHRQLNPENHIWG
jgi:hypothetical protein